MTTKEPEGWEKTIDAAFSEFPNLGGISGNDMAASMKDFIATLRAQARVEGTIKEEGRWRLAITHCDRETRNKILDTYHDLAALSSDNTKV